MYAVREGWRGRFDEDRASRERVVTYRAGKRGSERETTRREARRAENAADDTDERGERREESRATSAGGTPREGQGGRARGSEQDESEKERKARGKERRNQIPRGNGKERARKRARGGGAGGRERESAHRPARRRERDGRICVLKQTFDQSADCCQSYVAAAYPSVPVAGPRIQFRVFTRRGNQGPSARRGYPRKPRD